ncbi:MAG: hypothetical protein H6657_11615 [Ardenticatenaceae bacterium]|nr:hypothetical protein [Ardenticatenaceae bacterium]
MNQKKLAVWMTVILLITACARGVAPDVVSRSQISPNFSCPESVTIQGNTSLSPGETVSLAVRPTSFGWHYQWTAPDMSLLSAPQNSITEFTAPKSAQVIVLSVVVTPDQGCAAVTDSIQITVSSPPTFTPMATDTAQPTNTPTLTAAPTDAPTVELPATNTVAPTVALTNTPFYTPMPSQTPSPTVPSFGILLKEPKDETCVGSENAVFEWLATRPLNSIEGVNGEYFALNIWAEGSPGYSVSWIKNPRYEIENISDPIAVYTQLVNCSGEKGCYWNVDLIVSKVERGSGHLPESFTTLYSSPARWFCTEVAPRPIPPTNTPEPVATPCNLPPPQECGG